MTSLSFPADYDLILKKSKQFLKCKYTATNKEELLSIYTTCQLTSADIIKTNTSRDNIVFILTIFYLTKMTRDIPTRISLAKLAFDFVYQTEFFRHPKMNKTMLDKIQELRQDRYLTGDTDWLDFYEEQCKSAILTDFKFDKKQENSDSDCEDEADAETEEEQSPELKDDLISNLKIDVETVPTRRQRKIK